eukprot:167634-Rhodomonas_salina.1
MCTASRRARTSRRGTAAAKNARACCADANAFELISNLCVRLRIRVGVGADAVIVSFDGSVGLLSSMTVVKWCVGVCRGSGS